MNGAPKLLTKIFYGSGVRLMGCLQLSVKDPDFGNHLFVVREGKGEKDRFTILPDSNAEELQSHLVILRAVHEKDLIESFGEISLPYTLEKKYRSALKEWFWKYIFPVSACSIDSVSKHEKRYHLDPGVPQYAIHKAIHQANINKPTSPHTFRHSFATHLLQNGYDILTV